MSTGSRSRAGSASNMTGDMPDGLTQDALRMLRLEKFENLIPGPPSPPINVGETAETTGPAAVAVIQEEERQDSAEVKTDTIGVAAVTQAGPEPAHDDTAVAAATQPGPEAEPGYDDAAVAAATQPGPETEPEHDGDQGTAIAKDQLAEVHSDEASRAPIHAADIVVVDCLEGAGILGQVMRTHYLAATEGVGVPVPGSELGDERIPVGQEKDEEKDGDCDPAAITHSDLRSEVERKCRNNLEDGEGEQGPKLHDIIHRVDEGSEAVPDVAVSGLHADGDNSEVVPNGHINIDSPGGLDLEADKDGDGGRKIDGYRARDGNRGSIGKKTVESGLCGTGGETVSASQGTDQARAPHAATGSIGADNDAKMKAIDYDSRIRNIEKNMEQVLKKGGKEKTGTGGASWIQRPAPNARTPQRHDRQRLQQHALRQELVRLIVMVICCTVAILTLSRYGIISVNGIESGLHPVDGDGREASKVPISEKGRKGRKDPKQRSKSRASKKTTNIEVFGDIQHWALTLGDDGKLWTCVLERGGKTEFCEVVTQDMSLSAVKMLDGKGDSMLVNVAIKPPLSPRKWWNVFARKKKQRMRVNVTDSFPGSKSKK